MVYVSAPLWRAPLSDAHMKLESASDAKKANAGATSSGWAGRFIGVSAPNFAICAGVLLSLGLSGVQWHALDASRSVPNQTRGLGAAGISSGRWRRRRA